MTKHLTILAIIFSFKIFAQSELDTIIINDYKKYISIHGPGKGKTIDSAYYEIANDSIYYNGKGYFKTFERNYIIIKDRNGKVKSEGEYFDYYHDGKYTKYDKMGRKAIEGEYRYQSAQYVKIKRKRVYQPANSIKTGVWTFYCYKNYLDTTGYIERQIKYDF